MNPIGAALLIVVVFLVAYALVPSLGQEAISGLREFYNW